MRLGFERRHDDSAVAANRFSRGPVGGIAASTAPTLLASARLGVISTARASGSCSACAIRSAAIQQRPLRGDDDDLGGTGVEIDAAVAAISALAAAT
jgi:hypothetical protein